MLAHFTSSQTVDITVPEQPVPIQHYLRQPQRLIRALVDSSRTEQLSADVFRLKMRSLRFITISVQPTVDMKLWAEANGTIHIESTGSKIQGFEFIDRRFNLKLAGKLAPTLVDQKTHLVGRADLAVDVDIPPPLQFTPRAIIEATGNGLLSSVLITIKQRLMHQLLADYCAWARTQTESLSESGASMLSPDRSAI